MHFQGLCSMWLTWEGKAQGKGDDRSHEVRDRSRRNQRCGEMGCLPAPSGPSGPFSPGCTSHLLSLTGICACSPRRVRRWEGLLRGVTAHSSWLHPEEPLAPECQKFGSLILPAVSPQSLLRAPCSPCGDLVFLVTTSCFPQAVLPFEG